MKKYVFLSGLASLAFILGCATTDDLRQVQRRFDERIVTLQEENARLQKEIEVSRENIKPLRKSQADAGADLMEIRDQIQALKGAVEELRRDVSLTKTDRKDRETKLETKLNEILFRVSFLENFIGVGKKGESEEDRKDERQGTPAVRNGKLDREGVYALAYKEFKDGKYEEARRDFQKFLEVYPKAEYSDNAQFWLGECYYVEGKFEKAILEYEKVIKNFSNSDKVPHAMLKQSLSFLKLGDKSSAKLLLQQVIKDYPNTNQARIARQNWQK